MLIFSTEIPVPAQTTSASFLVAVQRWLGSLPGSALDADALSALNQQPQGRVISGAESVEWQARQSETGEQQAGVRYQRFKQRLTERVTLIFNATRSESALNIRVEQHHEGSTVQLAPYRHTLLMRGLLGTSLGGARDGALTVQSRPCKTSKTRMDSGSKGQLR